MTDNRTQARGRIRARTVLTAAFGAILVAGSALMLGPGGPFATHAPAPRGSVTQASGRMLDARLAPRFEERENASPIYSDPVEYLESHGVDVTLTGLAGFYQCLSSGRKSSIEAARHAALDALRERAGSAFAPILIGIADPHALDRDLVRFLGRARDRVAAPWLDARFRDASPGDLTLVARTRADLDIRNKASARALRARIASLGLLTPTSSGFSKPDAAALLASLFALGDGDVGTDLERILDDAPSVPLLAVSAQVYRGSSFPAAFLRAEAKLVKQALARPRPTFDDSRLLDVLGRTDDSRFAKLGARLLDCDSLPLRIAAARAAGAWRMRAMMPSLAKTLADARRAKGDARELVPPILWALGRLGEKKATSALLDFLRRAKEARAADFAVTALLDLKARPGNILLALPNRASSIGELPRILARVSMRDLAALDGKIKALPAGPLKEALGFARRLGAGKQVRGFIGEVAAGGGNLSLNLTFSDPKAVRRVLAGESNELDRTRALLAVSILPIPPEEQVSIAAEALSDASPTVRRTAAKVLARIGSTPAALALAKAVASEKVQAVREALALSLASIHPETAGPAAFKQFPGLPALQTLDPTSFAAVVSTLSGTKGSAGTKLLEEILAIHTGIEVRLAAARALSSRGVKAGTDLLAATVNEEDPVGRALAFEGLLATDPSRLNRMVSSDSGILAAGYDLLFTGVAREAPADADPVIFSFR